MKDHSAYYEHERREMDYFLPPSASRILEVGCGTGSFLLRAAEILGTSEAWGVELDVRTAQLARERGVNVIESSYPAAIDELPGKFDLVIFNDVLEHMTDPWFALQRTVEILSSDATVVVSLPNIANHSTLRMLFLNGDFRYQDEGVMDRDHLRFFTKRSAERMFAGAGFDVVEVRPLNRLLTLQILDRYAPLRRLSNTRIAGILFKQYAFKLMIAQRNS